MSETITDTGYASGTKTQKFLLSQEPIKDLLKEESYPRPEGIERLSHMAMWEERFHVQGKISTNLWSVPVGYKHGISVASMHKRKEE